jgi:hypothetical protein
MIVDVTGNDLSHGGMSWPGTSTVSLVAMQMVGVQHPPW